MLTFVTTNALSVPTLAAKRAELNIQNNQAALALSQPFLLLPELANIAEFVFGRDGFLTARDSANRWLGGSSLPLRVAREMLRKLEVTGVSGCLLAPTHAAQIRVSLDKLSSHQALIAIVPSLDELAQMLHCDDFSGDIGNHRLWLASGDNWADMLRSIFQQYPGLPTPSQFLRLPVVAGEINEPLIAAAQPIFAETQKARAEAAKTHRSIRKGTGRRIALIAPSHFRLWNDRGNALSRVFTQDRLDDLELTLIDPDVPTTACPFDLPRRVADCDGMITADILRSDLPNLISGEMPWITWLTTPRVPPIESAGLRDHLILADPSIATRAGWPAHRVHRANWPRLIHESPSQPPQVLAIVCDTSLLETPEDLNEFSSHRVLWDTLRQEISGNPFVLVGDPNTYLLNRLKQFAFNAVQFPTARFLSDLVYPAFAQAIAKMLISAKLPVKCYGTGWETIDGLTEHAAGPVSNRQQLEAIVRQPIALVDVWPGVPWHAARFAGCPLLSTEAKAREPLLRAAQTILAAPPAAGASSIPTLSLSLFREIVSSLAA